MKTTLSLILAFSMKVALGCSCRPEYNKIKEMAESYELIFFGKAISQHLVPNNEMPKEELIETTFEIITKWKGDSIHSDTVHILSDVANCCDCVLDIHVGMYYNIFANNRYVTACTPSSYRDPNDAKSLLLDMLFFGNKNYNGVKLSAASKFNLSHLDSNWKQLAKEDSVGTKLDPALFQVPYFEIQWIKINEFKLRSTMDADKRPRFTIVLERLPRP